jgi:transcription antitermination protein NusB
MAAANRSAARLNAVQALYQMDVSGTGVDTVFAEFESHWIGKEIEGDSYNPAEVAFFKDIVSGVLADQRAIDLHVDAALTKGWPLRRVETVVRAILRAGTYELRKRKDVPVRAIISEYVDIAAAFYDRDEAGLINAVLDTLARDFRAEEFQPKAG